MAAWFLVAFIVMRGEMLLVLGPFNSVDECLAVERSMIMIPLGVDAMVGHECIDSAPPRAEPEFSEWTRERVKELEGLR